MSMKRGTTAEVSRKQWDLGATFYKAKVMYAGLDMSDGKRLNARDNAKRSWLGYRERLIGMELVRRRAKRGAVARF